MLSDVKLSIPDMTVCVCVCVCVFAATVSSFLLADKSVQHCYLHRNINSFCDGPILLTLSA